MVVVTAVGANKINVIKAVREVTSLGLKEAKNFLPMCSEDRQGRCLEGEAESIKKKFTQRARPSR